ncbi:uncharacterized protein LOC126698278 [Quercus robur]|uniref:uncharacterized protein LOC126698278 n=1 Tax=Quercus robur TaxID=38942 RepID=UPI00216248EE|nr:uncharacterized protein LOC126698278 [Quercus robur]
METKLGGDRAKAITDRMPFDGVIHTNTIGYSGGLWLLSNSDFVEVELLAKTEQEIHIEVQVRNSRLNWLFFAIYASPKSEERSILWDNLAKVAELHKLSWVMAGDFNEPLIDEDKFGGRGVNINRSLAFKDCLDRCSMVDMGFLCPRYTWTNKRDISNLILERIDRFFMSPEWCVMYPNARVTHLPRCHSDHCPVLMEALPITWNGNRELEESIDYFSKDASAWNRNHFGNIHQKKRRILARLHGTQKALSINPSSSLVCLENQLLGELETILDQERDL